MNISLIFCFIIIIIIQCWKQDSKQINKKNWYKFWVYLLAHILNLIIIYLFRKCYQYIFIFKISFRNDDDKMYEIIYLFINKKLNIWHY